MIISRSILCSMDDLYRVNKAVQFYDLLKRLKLKTLASDCVIKKDNVKTLPLFIYYVKLHMLHPLISALILET